MDEETKNTPCSSRAWKNAAEIVETEFCSKCGEKTVVRLGGGKLGAPLTEIRICLNCGWNSQGIYLK